MAPSKLSETSSNINETQYELVQLKDQKLIDYTREQNGVAWQGDLTIQDYILRELVLSKSKLVDGNMMVFMLQSLNGRKPLCSVELLIRPGWKFKYISDRVIVEDVKCGTIGGVFTYPENRGKGYARIMIEKLVELSKSELIGPDGFTFLYSEVGEYYAKHGFKSYPIDVFEIPLKQQQVTKVDAHHEFIEYHQFETLMQEYNQKFKSDIIEKVKFDQKTRVTIVPDSHIIDWFHLRAKYVSYKLFHEKNTNNVIDFYRDNYEKIVSQLELENPNVYGIKLNAGGRLNGFIIWTVDFTKNHENTVTVLKIVSFDNNDEDKITLLESLKNYLLTRPILNQETKKIKLWQSEFSESSETLLRRQFFDIKVVENPSRSAILINNNEEDRLLKNDELIWEENSKLPWF